MDIPSPFDETDLDPELICEFFAVFSRFEFALKASTYWRLDRGVVQPAWWKFGEDAAHELIIEPESGLAEAIVTLCSAPPEIQTGPESWKPMALHGETDIENALDAALRVRNNLFHGGKHTPHSPPGRDNKLIHASLQLLFGCLEQNRKLFEAYVQNRS